jgi:hypothetical protein
VNRTSTIHLTNAAKKQTIPININVNSDPSLLLTTSDPEINESVTPNPALLLTTSEPEVNEPVIPYPEEVHNVTTIEEDKAPIEISNEMKRQQHKNKETLSLFNIFRKKH